MTDPNHSDVQHEVLPLRFSRFMQIFRRSRRVAPEFFNFESEPRQTLAQRNTPTTRRNRLIREENGEGKQNLTFEERERRQGIPPRYRPFDILREKDAKEKEESRLDRGRIRPAPQQSPRGIAALPPSISIARQSAERLAKEVGADQFMMDEIDRTIDVEKTRRTMF